MRVSGCGWAESEVTGRWWARRGRCGRTSTLMSLRDFGMFLRMVASMLDMLACSARSPTLRSAGPESESAQRPSVTSQSPADRVASFRASRQTPTTTQPGLSFERDWLHGTEHAGLRSLQRPAAVPADAALAVRVAAAVALGSGAFTVAVRQRWTARRYAVTRALERFGQERSLQLLSTRYPLRQLRFSLSSALPAE